MNTRRLAVLSTLVLLTISTPLFADNQKGFSLTATVAEQLTFDPTSRCFDPAKFPAPPITGLTGNTQGVSDDTKHLGPGPVQIVTSDCPNLATLDFTDGRLTLTNKKGEQLRGTYQGQLVPVGPAPTGLRTKITGTVIITGGTGRFENATGSGVLGGFFDLTPSYSASGQIIVTGIYDTKHKNKD